MKYFCHHVSGLWAVRYVGHMCWAAPYRPAPQMMQLALQNDFNTGTRGITQ
jgi:hypothetical protein